MDYAALRDVSNCDIRVSHCVEALVGLQGSVELQEAYLNLLVVHLPVSYGIAEAEFEDLGHELLRVYLRWIYCVLNICIEPEIVKPVLETRGIFNCDVASHIHNICQL